MAKFNLDYLKTFKFAIIFSTILVGSFVVLFFTKGLNYGVDFRGGAEIQVKLDKSIDLASLRNTLETSNIPTSSLQTIGDDQNNEFLIKLQTNGQDHNKLASELEASLKKNFGEDKVDIQKTDIVGPKAGAELRTSGLKAIIWSLLGIMIYIGLRFDFKFAPGAIVATFHDVAVIIGAFLITQKEFSLQTVAAILAIIGYSVNDTVVIYDRVRELEDARPGVKISKIVNDALNETMSRTILTSLMTLSVCLVMFFMGGGVIHDFFFALCIGIISGTYSTIYVASPVTIWLDGITKNNKNKSSQVKHA
jgi:preprotein translocase subunit SecF